MEEKYKNQETVQLRCKLLLASNGGIYLPAGSEDEAFYRRLIVLPFVRGKSPDQIVADFPRHLQKEKYAIVSKAVRSLRNIINEDGGIVFHESALSRSIKEAWYTQPNPAMDFVRDNLEFTASPDDYLFKDEIYEAYQFYLQHDIPESVKKNMVVLKRNDLMTLIRRNYPGIQTGKMRRENNKSPTACIRCLKWTDQSDEPVN